MARYSNGIGNGAFSHSYKTIPAPAFKILFLYRQIVPSVINNNLFQIIFDSFYFLERFTLPVYLSTFACQNFLFLLNNWVIVLLIC